MTTEPMTPSPDGGMREAVEVTMNTLKLIRDELDIHPPSRGVWIDWAKRVAGEAIDGADAILAMGGGDAGPMATAPHDGTEILALTKSLRWFVTHWISESVKPDHTYEYWWSGFDLGSEPLCWRQLPAIPPQHVEGE